MQSMSWVKIPKGFPDWQGKDIIGKKRLIFSLLQCAKFIDKLISLFKKSLGQNFLIDFNVVKKL